MNPAAVPVTRERKHVVDAASVEEHVTLRALTERAIHHNSNMVAIKVPVSPGLSRRFLLYWLQALSCRHFRVSSPAGIGKGLTRRMRNLTCPNAKIPLAAQS